MITVGWAVRSGRLWRPRLLVLSKRTPRLMSNSSTLIGQRKWMAPKRFPDTLHPCLTIFVGIQMLALIFRFAKSTIFIFSTWWNGGNTWKWHPKALSESIRRLHPDHNYNAYICELYVWHIFSENKEGSYEIMNLVSDLAKMNNCMDDTCSCIARLNNPRH